MPRNVRNFWIEFEVDGNKTNIATGPASKDGGFSMRIMQRSNGSVMHAVTIEGYAIDGDIRLQIRKGGDVYNAPELPPYTQNTLHGFDVTSKR